MKRILGFFIAAAGAGFLVSCNSFLDREPITSVSTESYLYAEADLGAYAANFYGNLPSHGTSYDLGLFDDDNGTDNQVASTPSSLFLEDRVYVGDYNLWASYSSVLRSINYFFDTVLPRYENGELSGGEVNIRHYIGEMYFFRAFVNYQALVNLGDFPILTSVIIDEYEAVREASKRRPRNEFARFILEDLSNAYDFMQETPPMTNRLTKACAALMASRVALFEGTWEKYFAGTPFVPDASAGWPGAEMDYLADYSYDNESEYRYFLGEAVRWADIVASSVPLYQDYEAIFNSVDLSGIQEVLLWRQYSMASDINIFHYAVSYLQRNGSGNSGFTRSMVDSYLMQNGLPIYDSGSGYLDDRTYANLLEGRDPRMSITVEKTGNVLSVDPVTVTNIEYLSSIDGDGYWYRAPIFNGTASEANPTGYSIRKGLNTAGDMAPGQGSGSYTGCPTFRAAEAYLNYIEAYYELNGSLGGNCDTYWRALRNRVGLDPDYQKSIDATDMYREAKIGENEGVLGDWGCWSAGQLVDATLYNIRRERRVELAAEGFRLNDLKRWRALDQVQAVHIQGFNLWDEMYTLYTDPDNSNTITPLVSYELQEYGVDDDPNVSARNDPYAEGKYFLPYRRNGNQEGGDGLTWTMAHYLYPIRNAEFRLTTEVEGSNDYDSSTIYQNPYWSKEDGTLPMI